MSDAAVFIGWGFVGAAIPPFFIGGRGGVKSARLSLSMGLWALAAEQFERASRYFTTTTVLLVCAATAFVLGATL